MKRFSLKIFFALLCVTALCAQHVDDKQKVLPAATPAVKEADVSKSVVTPSVATPKPVKKEPAKPALSLVNQIKIVIYSSHTDPIIITSLDIDIFFA